MSTRRIADPLTPYSSAEFHLRMAIFRLYRLAQEVVGENRAFIDFFNAFLGLWSKVVLPAGELVECQRKRLLINLALEF